MNTEVGERLKPAFLSARDAGEWGQVQELERQHQQLMRNLFLRFRKAFISPKLRLWYQASLYDALELAADMETALQAARDSQGGPTEPALLSDASSAALLKSLKVIRAVSPGSDLHVILASQYHHGLQQQQQSPDAQACSSSALGNEVDEALALSAESHLLRYGQISNQVLNRLADYNRTMYE